MCLLEYLQEANMNEMELKEREFCSEMQKTHLWAIKTNGSLSIYSYVLFLKLLQKSPNPSAEPSVISTKQSA